MIVVTDAGKLSAAERLLPQRRAEVQDMRNVVQQLLSCYSLEQPQAPLALPVELAGSQATAYSASY